MSTGSAPAARVIGLFRPILPGATARARLFGIAGALVAIALTALIGSLTTGDGLATVIIAAPLGATAVLLFVVPSSPLAQPWPVVGGCVLSALVGVGVAELVSVDILAAGLAVGGAIAAMTVARCMHPPGGAVALLAVVGGPEVADLGWSFAAIPVALDAIVMTACAVVFHKLVGQPYPQRPVASAPGPAGTLDPPAEIRIGFNRDDIDAAIEDLGHAVDVSRDDIAALLRRVQSNALERTHGGLVIADIMARDVIACPPETGLAAARAILLDRGIRTMPVVDDDKRLLGAVGLRELLAPGTTVADVMREPVTAAARDNALHLVGPLTDGRNHAAYITSNDGRLVGIVTQTDLLVALSRTPPQDASARG